MEPVKRQKIINILKCRIADSYYPAGTKLPNELVLSEEFSVARETLRGALRELEKDELIRRNKRQGTFVNSGSSNDLGIAIIYFLLPCSDYFIKSHYIARLNCNALLAGALTGAHANNAQIITLPISPNNTQKDIDWEKLRCLKRGSMVMFSGNWFSPIFQLLSERGCRVAHIHNFNYQNSSWEKYTRQHLTLNLYDGAEIAVNFLYQQGCRRIAILESYLYDPINQTLPNFQSALQKRHLTDSFIGSLPDVFNIKMFRDQLAELYDKTHFDGIFCALPDDIKINYSQSLNQNLGLPESVKIITNYNYGFNQHLSPPVEFIDCDYEKFGKKAVEILLSKAHFN